jgi:uncharacterized protein with FMN-binding domain
MPKSYAKREKERARQQAKLGAQASQPASGSTAARHKHRRRRLTDGLIGMSSAAILTIYGLGYAHTQSASGEDAPQFVAPSPATPSSNGPLVLAPTPTLKPGTYRDGTYKAVGTSRHGDIEATVVVKNGKIASADVSGCGTRYPCSDVNPLISEVVSRQGAPVHYMSGATDSSQAYTRAVKSALAQAS